MRGEVEVMGPEIAWL